ncbi:probable ethanolamine kinase isoform X2 [Daucus carota subsp. sativus]|uniref:probable ethanolamine kinase isoform X2 n=1 Tax=Daucus carota subsp. sativus TaxID=79200 RepID=UPI0007EF8203|nr:PREDICTED: probable ethanolamine kinase isoform X2 [Daucus carota subsp. sativus]
MGAVKIWNAMEIAEVAGESSNSEIPHSSLTVDHTLSLSDMKPRIVELYKDLFKNWSNKDESDFSIETVSGGITNLLLKVSVKEDSGNTIKMTLRLYGPNTEYVINRERELQAIQYLSAAGFGAKLLGVFGNGMVQSFIHARTLVPLDMRKPDLAAKIAKQLRKFHQVEVPGSKEPQLWNDIFKFFKQGRLDAPVVFAHNDLLSGNLMLNDDEGKLYFIDFEYGSYSYRGFDIGNHFNEYAGYDCDYSLYPNRDEQYHFFKHYLKPDKPQEVSEKDLEELYVETNCYMLASHMYWALWALIQARMSPIDFDYLGYFFLRYDEFKRQKEKCLSLAESYLTKYGAG